MHSSAPSYEAENRNSRQCQRVGFRYADEGLTHEGLTRCERDRDAGRRREVQGRGVEKVGRDHLPVIGAVLRE